MFVLADLCNFSLSVKKEKKKGVIQSFNFIEAKDYIIIVSSCNQERAKGIVLDSDQLGQSNW